MSGHEIETNVRGPEWQGISCNHLLLEKVLTTEALKQRGLPLTANTCVLQGHDGVREGRRERSRSPPRGDWLAPIAPPPEPMAGPLPRPSISTPTPAATLPPAAPRNDDARLIDLLRRRHEARQVRDYPTSDALRSELAALGVYTDDRAKTWRSRDGRTGSLEGPDYLAPIQPPPSAAGGYDSAAAAAYGSAATVRYMSIEEIHAQLTAREQARQSKDFSTADAIRRSLNACGISVCDRTKTWSSKDGRGGPRPDARGNIPAPDPYAASAPDSYGGQGGDPYAAQGSQDPGAGYYQQYGGYDYSTYYQQQGYQQQSQQGGYN